MGSPFVKPMILRRSRHPPRGRRKYGSPDICSKVRPGKANSVTTEMGLRRRGYLNEVLTEHTYENDIYMIIKDKEDGSNGQLPKTVARYRIRDAGR